MPSRRPDIFPEFDKPERVFLPKPLPGDPEMPDEELEESTKRTTPGDPDPEQVRRVWKMWRVWLEGT